MIPIPLLTSELLQELGKELSGCDFSEEYQRSFLSATESRDVQAVPGNGKTTLLVAKLVLLSRSWTSRIQGVCVISHTNAARNEVEKKLFNHPAASAFLSYPHFIGTVTAFIDRFIALPYLRGLGWSVQRIDDEVFSSIALSRWGSKPALLKYSRINGGKNQHALERYVMNLELADDFECLQNILPQRLKVRQRKRQPGPQSRTGAALEELKAEIIKDGYYRFADMNALAHQAIKKCPNLIARIHKRFPLVLLDEAQDTNGDQLALLNLLFSDGVAYQRLGDENQTLYEDESLTHDDYWKANRDVIPLNKTRRFGVDLATFSSRLTVRTSQQIQGLPDHPSRRVLILFDTQCISNVLPAYADEVRIHWGDGLTSGYDIRAVASRHNPARDTTGGWPKTLIDYCPNYRSRGNRRNQHQTLCSILRQVSIMFEDSSEPVEIARLITSAVVSLMRHQGHLDADNRDITVHNLWITLAAKNPTLPLKIKRLVRDWIIKGNAAWNSTEWETFRNELIVALEFKDVLTPESTKFLEFVQDIANDDAVPGQQQSKTVFDYDGITVKLGSIHSVKGRTVDSILVVETEVWRGQALADRAMDLETVLPHAFGLENRDFSNHQVQLSAATNIFVAVTRPRYLLSFAMRKDVANEKLIAAARTQGWIIRDLTLDHKLTGEKKCDYQA